MTTCPTCQGDLEPGLTTWHRVCRTCSYEGSTLRPHILEQSSEGDLDEAAREDALAPLRQKNFAVLARRLEEMFKHQAAPRRPRLLDVGCAHGWFLNATKERFDGLGIEPDPVVAAAALLRGTPLRQGFFPEVLQVDERFDAIVFNDVLEHIPDVVAVLMECRTRLEPDGILVVNAPDRRGVLYRVSKVLASLGRPASFARMWQEGFPSPHVHYFDTASIRRLAARTGFDLVSVQRLDSISVKGLYARTRYSRELSAWKAGMITAAVALVAPLFPVLPSDISVWILKPRV